MRLYLKNTILLSCIAVVTGLGSCKPDAIVANYSCMQHYYSNNGPNAVYDSVIGFAGVMVYKSSSDGNTLIINGKTTGVYSAKYSNSSRNAYITGYASNGDPLLAYFILGSDSIWMQTSLESAKGYQAYYYYAGHKE